MGKAEDEKKYYLKNKEKIKAYLRKYYLKNKEKIKEKSKENYYNNRENQKLYKKDYYLKNKLQLDEKNKKWKKNNKEKFAKYVKNYMIYRRKVDPNFRIKHKLRTRLNIVLKKYAEGKKFSSESYGIDYGKIIEHLKPFPKHMEEYHIDHIKPLCSFDLTDPQQIKKAFAPENHQWLLAKENLKKGGKE